MFKRLYKKTCIHILFFRKFSYSSQKYTRWLMLKNNLLPFYFLQYYYSVLLFYSIDIIISMKKYKLKQKKKKLKATHIWFHHLFVSSKKTKRKKRKNNTVFWLQVLIVRLWLRVRRIWLWFKNYVFFFQQTGCYILFHQKDGKMWLDWICELMLLFFMSTNILCFVIKTRVPHTAASAGRSGYVLWYVNFSEWATHD